METLLIIDVQKAIDHPKWGMRNNPDAERKMGLLLTRWRQNKWPIIHIQHSSNELKSPYRPNQPLHDFKDEVLPKEGELIIIKSSNNAFVETDLGMQLNTKNLVICGVLTQHSVDCTARMASSLGYTVKVVEDATAATSVTDRSGKNWSAEEVHELTLSHLEADYAEIVQSDLILKECL